MKLLRKIWLLTAFMLTFAYNAEGKVVHLRQGAELPVAIPSALQHGGGTASWTVTGNTGTYPISIRTRGTYYCTLYTESRSGEATLTCIRSYNKQIFTWKIRISPAGDRTIYPDIEDEDYFQSLNDDNRLVLYQCGKFWDEKCAYVTSSPNDVSCVDETIEGIVTIPEEAQGLPVRGINERAFHGMFSLTGVVLPKSLKYVAGPSIQECSKLEFVKCLATTPPIGEVKSLFDYRVFTNATLYVPSNSVSAYKQASGWSQFNKIEAITSSSTADGIKIDATNFPDAVFRNYLLSQTYGSDGIITESEIQLLCLQSETPMSR